MSRPSAVFGGLLAHGRFFLPVVHRGAPQIACPVVGIMTKNTTVIAIDGAAASGKSTLGRLLPERLGYLYFDTGVMYRAVTSVALQRGISIDDEAAVTALVEHLRIRVTPPTRLDGRQYTVYADGMDVTLSLIHI